MIQLQIYKKISNHESLIMNLLVSLHNIHSILATDNNNLCGNDILFSACTSKSV